MGFLVLRHGSVHLAFVLDPFSTRSACIITCQSVLSPGIAETRLSLGTDESNFPARG